MWTWESIRPGIAVMPPASITTSQASTAAAFAVPALTILPSWLMTVSPSTNGACQSPETMVPRLVIATFMRRLRFLLVLHPVELVAQTIRPHQLIDHRGRIVPVIGAETVPRGDETRARIEHLVLLVARTEFGTDRIPAGLQEFDLVGRLEARRALRGLDDLVDHGIAEILDRGRQHDHGAAGKFADRVDE